MNLLSNCKQHKWRLYVKTIDKFKLVSLVKKLSPTCRAALASLKVCLWSRSMVSLTFLMSVWSFFDVSNVSLTFIMSVWCFWCQFDVSNVSFTFLMSVWRFFDVSNVSLTFVMSIWRFFDVLVSNKQENVLSKYVAFHYVGYLILPNLL